MTDHGQDLVVTNSCSRRLNDREPKPVLERMPIRRSHFADSASTCTCCSDDAPQGIVPGEAGGVYGQSFSLITGTLGT